jgi:hypothetical protein
MTQMNKFEDLNGRFASLGTGMTQQRKFRDRWCTLLFFLITQYIADCACVMVIGGRNQSGFHWALLNLF